MLVEPDRQIPVELVQELCNLAVWAPNHKKTWPWRFALFTGDGRARLGEAFVADMIAAGVGDEARRAKTLTKYLRTPAILVAGSAHDDDPMLHAENRDAVAAGVQNLLLGATARGLASFWSSPPLADAPTRRRRVWFRAGDEPDRGDLSRLAARSRAGARSPTRHPSGGDDRAEPRAIDGRGSCVPSSSATIRGPVPVSSAKPSPTAASISS